MAYVYRQNNFNNFNQSNSQISADFTKVISVTLNFLSFKWVFKLFDVMQVIFQWRMAAEQSEQNFSFKGFHVFRTLLVSIVAFSLPTVIFVVLPPIASGGLPVIWQWLWLFKFAYYISILMILMAITYALDDSIADIVDEIRTTYDVEVEYKQDALKRWLEDAETGMLITGLILAFIGTIIGYYFSKSADGFWVSFFASIILWIFLGVVSGGVILMVAGVVAQFIIILAICLVFNLFTYVVCTFITFKDLMTGRKRKDTWLFLLDTLGLVFLDSIIVKLVFDRVFFIPESLVIEIDTPIGYELNTKLLIIYQLCFCGIFYILTSLFSMKKGVLAELSKTAIFILGFIIFTHFFA